MPISNRIRPIKKRNIIAVVLALFVLISSVRYCSDYSKAKIRDFGMLTLPGAGELSYSVKMPFYGGLTVALKSASTDGRKVVVEPGEPANGEICYQREPGQQSGESQPVLVGKVVSNHDRWSCWAFEYYGVLRSRLYDDSTNTLLETIYLPGMYKMPTTHRGVVVAQFRALEKGRQLRVEVKAYAIFSQKNQERRLLRVRLEPAEHPLQGTVP